MKIGLMVYEPLRDQSGGYLYDRKIIEHLQDGGNELFIYTFPFDLAKIIEDAVQLLIEDELCHEDLLEFNVRLRKVSSIPLIALAHHLRYLEPVFQWEDERERQFLRTCDAIIASSNSTSTKVSELGIQLPTVVAHPGCDLIAPDSNSRKRLSESFLNLLFVGILIPRKGVHILLDALTELTHYPWELRIVGDETLDVHYVGSLREKALKLGERVQFLGRVPTPELSWIYLDSDLLILPSYFEGYGIVAAEAVLHLLPTLASRVGGIPEIIHDGKEGILFAPGDRSALKQALQDFFEHPEYLNPLIQACALRRSSLPTWGETGRLIDDFLSRFGPEQERASRYLGTK
jgi:glycosyltransferase involved in cell wall biosynthesis